MVLRYEGHGIAGNVWKNKLHAFVVHLAALFLDGQDHQNRLCIDVLHGQGGQIYPLS